MEGAYNDTFSMCCSCNGFFIILICIQERKIPGGLIEWGFIIGALAVMLDWSMKY